MIITIGLVLLLVATFVGIALLYRRWRARPTTTLTVASPAGFAEGDTIGVNGDYYVIEEIDGLTFTVRRR